MEAPLPKTTLATGRACAVAFLAAFSALFLQVLVHRIISAKLLSDYAFLVISLTMLGFAGAGAVLSLVLRGALERLSRSLVLCAAAFTLTALLAAVAFYQTTTTAPFAYTRPGFVQAFLQWIPFALLFALPFAAIAFMLGLLLAAPHLDTRRIYFFDLVGSALGAVLVLPAIQTVGVETSYLVLLALFPLLVLALVPASARGRRVAGAAVAAVVLAAAGRERLFDLRPAGGSPVDEARRAGGLAGAEYERWDPLARVELTPIRPPDPGSALFRSLVGDDPRFLARFEKMLTQNNYAYAYAVRYDGDPASLAGVQQTLYAAGYVALGRPPGRVVAIGVGGGFDILTALHFGSGSVTGVEVNGTILRMLERDRRDYFGPWVEDPRVSLVWDEGRHFLATSPARYDLVQLSGVDSYSGTPAAAHVFSESYLYTQEAFALFLSRLAEGGVLHVMRKEEPLPREMLRAVVTAVAALRARGVAEPARHIVTLTATSGAITSLLVKAEPFTAAEVARLRAWAESARSFTVTAAPGLAAAPNAYQSFLALGGSGKERAFAAGYPFDITPADDDRPFFFHFSKWWHVFPSDPTIWSATPTMEYSLILLAVTVGAAAWLVVRLPLRRLARASAPPGLFRYGVFFTGIGLAFMAVEIALLQRFSLLLGHPSYALSVVLAVLLFASGLGSWFAGALLARLRGPRFLAYALCGVILAQVLLLPWPALLTAWPPAARLFVVVGCVAVPGLLMGVFLPTGLDRLKAEAPAYVPWAWGVNGIASVLGPIFSIAVAMTVGNTLLLLCALPLYILAGAALQARPSSN